MAGCYFSKKLAILQKSRHIRRHFEVGGAYVTTGGGACERERERQRVGVCETDGDSAMSLPVPGRPIYILLVFTSKSFELEHHIIKNSRSRS